MPNGNYKAIKNYPIFFLGENIVINCCRMMDFTNTAVTTATLNHLLWFKMYNPQEIDHYCNSVLTLQCLTDFEACIRHLANRRQSYSRQLMAYFISDDFSLPLSKILLSHWHFRYDQSRCALMFCFHFSAACSFLHLLIFSCLVGWVSPLSIAG